MRKILFGAVLCALLGLAVPARAQDAKPVFSHYDLSGTSTTYCAFDQTPIAVSPRIKTSGSNATVTAVAGEPFLDVTQWAELYISTPIGNFVRTVTARASATSITVDTALDISSGASFTYRNIHCGTTATDGWFPVSQFTNGFRLTWVLEQINATSIDMRFECIDALVTATANPIYPDSDATTGCGAGTVSSGYCNFTAAAILSVDVFQKWDRCRLGMKVNTDAGVQKITGYYAGSK